MARTALDLRAEELEGYRPDREPAEWMEAERWERAWKVARIAARLLREAFGARRVVAFGSLAHRDWFSPWSDVDLAAWGIPPDQFYRAVASVTSLSPDFEMDLVDAESCRPALRRFIEREGVDL
jgi:predicted nucleotidyltransferase